MMNNKNNKAFKACVEISRRWEGEEVAKELIQKIKNKVSHPKFILLFATIDYKNEFKKILSGIKDEFSDSPLIGGTVAGFITPEGCYTRGVTALAVEYPKMDIAVGIGYNTKRTPKKAAKLCAKMIEEKLKNSKWKNRFLYIVNSGVMIPRFPLIGQKSVIKSKFTGKLMTLFSESLTKFQRGIGREEEVLEELVKLLPNYYIFGGSSYDNNKMVTNYQFLNKKVLTNVIIAIGICSDLKIQINTSYGLKKTGIEFKATKLTFGKRAIQEINGKPAVKELLKIMKWPKNILNERIHRITYYTPIGFEKNGVLYPEVMGFFMGNNIICGYKIENPKLSVLSASGKSLLNSIDKNLIAFKNKNNLIFFMISCSVRLETLGSKIFKVREKILNHVKNTPFLLLYGAGEDVYIPEKKIFYHINEAFNVASMYKG